MKAKTSSKFLGKSISRFIFCSFFPVGLEDYVDYFKETFNDFIFLRWRFPHSKDKKAFSTVQYYLEGKFVDEKKLFSFSFAGKNFLYFLFLPFNYTIYFFQSVFIIGLIKRKSRGSGKVVFMGINYFCTLCGIFLRKIGKVDFVIYRVMDFFPLPPSGFYRILNRIFYVIDKFCLDNSDSVWFTTEGHIVGREKYGYFDRKKYQYQMIPLGLDLKKFVNKPFKFREKNSLVYCGVVSRYHMLDLVFEVIIELKNKLKGLKFHIIGSGPDIDYYKTLASDNHLVDTVVFHGFMNESEEFRKIMSNNILGIALYKDEENFMKYTEPAKVKYYLSFGIPAIVSKVAKISMELEKRRVSFAVNNDKAEIVRKILDFFSSPEKQDEYALNISNFVKEIDIRNLLEKTFGKTFGHEEDN